MKRQKKQVGVISYTILQVVELFHPILKGINHVRKQRGYRYILSGSSATTYLKKRIAKDRAYFEKELKCQTTVMLDFVVIFNNNLERDVEYEQKIESIFSDFPPSETETY